MPNRISSIINTGDSRSMSAVELFCFHRNCRCSLLLFWGASFFFLMHNCKSYRGFLLQNSHFTLQRWPMCLLYICYDCLHTFLSAWWMRSCLATDFQRHMNASHSQTTHNFGKNKLRRNIHCNGLICLSYNEAVKWKQWLRTRHQKQMQNTDIVL